MSDDVDRSPSNVVTRGTVRVHVTDPHNPQRCARCGRRLRGSYEPLKLVAATNEGEWLREPGSLARNEVFCWEQTGNMPG